jgi:nicotinate phosphoribosyltransferase
MTPDPPVSLWPDPEALGPVTDLYQLTMMAGYAASGIADARATFEVFVRRLPAGRSYLVFAGLEQAVRDVLHLKFTAEQVAYIRSQPAFAAIDPAWFDGLARFRFTGDLWSVPEGTVVFAGEPLVRVTAPLAEAQLVETLLLASLGYPTLVASKASRIVEAAEGRGVIDFGARRGHGAYSGFLCARASYLAGFAGTSHVEAARRLGIPAFGTMAHAWIQAFGDEPAAFAAFARSFPSATTLLVDTYDTDQGVRHAAAIEPPIQAIRLDSGDLLEGSKSARAILDGLDRRSVKILASNDLNETSIAELVAAGAPIDAFGVGTELITSRDAPAISMVYKLVELDGTGRIKLSAGKKTYPLAKQIHRVTGPDGQFAFDRVTRADETSEGEPLLAPVIEGGRLVASLPGLEAIRERRACQVAALPEGLRGVSAVGTYPIQYSDALEAEATRLGVRGAVDLSFTPPTAVDTIRRLARGVVRIPETTGRGEGRVAFESPDREVNDP